MFRPKLNIFGPGLKSVPISTVEVPIGTLQVLIGTPLCSAQFPFLVHFGLFFGHFLGRDLYLDIFQTCIPNIIHFNLIIKSLKE